MNRDQLWISWVVGTTAGVMFGLNFTPDDLGLILGGGALTGGASVAINLLVQVIRGK
jgi:hypothetical protein